MDELFHQYQELEVPPNPSKPTQRVKRQDISTTQLDQTTEEEDSKDIQSTKKQAKEVLDNWPFMPNEQ